MKSILVEKSYQKVYGSSADLICFRLENDDQNYIVDTNYFVGIDWLVKGKAAVCVEPKLNDLNQVDFLGMLFESLNATENLEHLDGLLQVEYESPWIPIPSQKDQLSPFLIIQFLKLVQRIVRKGLKKSYYSITENLTNKIKGKTLIGEQIKKNVIYNKSTKTICNYQVFGPNTTENKFLKLVLKFVTSYVSQNQFYFEKTRSLKLRYILSFCLPAFDCVDSLDPTDGHIEVNKNIFFNEYEEALKIGNYILKRFSFNLNNTSQTKTTVPPFWIDMSKLFELYVFNKLRRIFPDPKSMTYHDEFKGRKQTDILVRVEGFKCIIDCKYKNYHNASPSLEDKRQLAGYTRLKSVYKKLDVSYSSLIKGLIIYPHQGSKQQFEFSDLFSNKIDEYIDFYKLGICLPAF